MTIAPPLYLQNRGYLARHDRQLIGDIFRPGVLRSSDLVPTASVSSRGVDVAAGVAYVLGSESDDQGTYRVYSDDVSLKAIDAAVTFPRIDFVIVRVYDQAESGVLNQGSIEVVKGTETSGATLENMLGAPSSLPDNSLVICDVLAPIGSGLLTGANLRDRRVLNDADEFGIQGAAGLVQEGVVSGGVVTRLGANSIRVSAGSGWIDGDGVVVDGETFGGRYHVTWPQTDLAPSSAAANERGYRVVIPLPAGGHGASTPQLAAGTDQAAVDHDALQGVPALASARLQVATVIVGTSGVSVTNDATQGIRDRRKWALGARGYVEFGTDGTPGSAVWNDYSWLLRLELSGLWPLRFQPAMNMTSAGAITAAEIQMRYDGVRTGEGSGVVCEITAHGMGSGRIATIVDAPVAGSHLLAPSVFPTAGGFTIKTGSRIYVWEDVGASLRSNGNF